jgi:transposase
MNKVSGRIPASGVDRIGGRPVKGEPGHNDRQFLKAVHYLAVYNINWRALPPELGKWNSIWNRFWRLSCSGIFDVFFETLAQLSKTAHLVHMFDSTVVRAHVSAAGAKGVAKSSVRTLRGWVLVQNPPQNRHGRPSNRLPSDRRGQ